MNTTTTAQDMPTFSIVCLDSSDMPASEDLDLLLSLENLWLPEFSAKLENVESTWYTVDRAEMARAAGLEIETHEAAKWRCSSEDKKRAAALAAAIISNHKAQTKFIEEY
eukprot:CAMPEP_0172176296 /NCGR_PEP_ID=MMETSP1050-20130122/14719_1 /TAXON_ID=233186 /ORGANISM="Cryptomonas curvata, Strain CCAP979/52" /LENGTH=109 /DNA_ID=CAMNT_0012848523 /DNA_START=337 /DNA_END=666 /DNA_ORIENTATION=+